MVDSLSAKLQSHLSDYISELRLRIWHFFHLGDAVLMSEVVFLKIAFFLSELISETLRSLTVSSTGSIK